MAPSIEFAGNLFYAITFFVYSAGIRFRWFTRGQWINQARTEEAAAEGRE